MASDDEISNHGWEVHTYNMSDIPSDKYTILSYESKKTRYGKTYLLTCTPNDGETVLYLWANSYLTEYIEKSNPKLPELYGVGLTFEQKLKLMPSDNEFMISLVPGIRQLNKIRNRLAHNLKVEVTNEDRSAFLGVNVFAAMQNDS